MTYSELLLYHKIRLSELLYSFHFSKKVMKLNIIFYELNGAHGSVVGGHTMLQAGRL